MFFCFQGLEILQPKKTLLCSPVIMAAKDCNFIPGSICWAHVRGPLLETGVSLVHWIWMVSTYIHEIPGISYLLVQNCLWNFSGDRGTQRTGRIKSVPDMSWTAYGCYCFNGGFAATCPVPTRCRSLSCY